MPVLSLLTKIPLWAWILVVALCVVGIQQWRIHHYKAQSSALQGVANTLHDANQTNLATIADLRIANDAWANKCKTSLEAQHEAVQSVAIEAKAKARAAADIDHLQYQVKHDAIIKSWAEQSVPADVVRMLAEGGSTN